MVPLPLGLNVLTIARAESPFPIWTVTCTRPTPDRANRPIFVYRFLTVGTVEARIQGMQERKKKLADGILQEQAADSVAFTLDDVESLFAPVEGG